MLGPKQISLNLIWKLNNPLLSNQRLKGKIKQIIRKYFEVNENEDTIHQNLQDAAKEF